MRANHICKRPAFKMWMGTTERGDALPPDPGVDVLTLCLLGKRTKKAQISSTKLTKGQQSPVVEST